jgi:type II secretory pathway pseudopilin PulG
MFNLKNPRKAFSLVEIILAGAIMAVLFSTVTYYYVNMSRQGQKVEREAHFINTSRSFLSLLKTDIRSAELIRFAENEIHIEAAALTAAGRAESRDVRYEWDGTGISRTAIGYEEETDSASRRYDYTKAIQENEKLFLVMKPVELFGDSNLARVYTIDIYIGNSTGQKIFSITERVYLEQL